MEVAPDSIQLLHFKSGSSDEQEYVLQQRFSKRTRKPYAPLAIQDTKHCVDNCYENKFCIPFVFSLLLGITLWLLALTWTATQVRIELENLRDMAKTVSAGNKGIPESLQGYHTLTRELQKNQTKINEDLIRVAFQLSNFSNVMSTMQSDLARVQKKLEDSQPRLNDPSSLQTLTTSVASFKDQIDELQSKAISISDEQIKIRTLIASLNSNMTDLSKSVQELRNHTEDSQSHADIVTEVLNKVQPELDYLNKTLSTREKWYDDILPVQRMVSDTSDKIKVVQSLIETMRGDLLKQNDTITVIQSDFNNATVEWNILMRDMKILQSNMSRFIANCSQCRYEQPFTDIPAVLTSEISNNASYITADDRVT